MSLITRAQAARTAAEDLAANGPGWFKRRERAAHDTIRDFVSRAMSLPDNVELPAPDRGALQSQIEATVATLERYLERPGDRSGSRTASDQALVKAVYALRDAEEQVSQRKHFTV